MAEYVSKDTLYSMCQPTGVFRLHVSHIDQMPAADVAPVVHAQPVLFFDDPFTGRRFTTCSNCDGKIGKRDRYCRHCGARMDGGTQ